jgi:hypothetical protein
MIVHGIAHCSALLGCLFLALSGVLFMVIAWHEYRPGETDLTYNWFFFSCTAGAFCFSFMFFIKAFF